MKRIAIAVAALAMTSVAFGQDFDTWDRNDDDVLTEREFRRGFQGFETWDADSSRTVDMDEFTAGMGQTELFANHDADRDGFLEPNELGDLDEPDDFHEWDTDGDGMVSRDEFHTELFDEFDDDDDLILTRTEVAEGWFDLWDTDDDDRLSRGELDVGWTRAFGAAEIS